MTASLIYITCESAAEAERIGRALVLERLAACTNMIPGMRSIYLWNGAVQTGEEVVLLAKTRSERVDALIARVRELHSYEVPCAVELPLARGNPDYLAWIEAETGPKA